ncbi:hypothetical protein G6F62_000182 [Rhizopus arrhizus]|uniref:Rad60/SUMO-like domain-containing protein n=1 Tax=Rhizopus oryzae TaxID=64495 RepID=A0A9P7BYE6_RHIOR|nr:hypothetical protein G6F23_000274 [Rhizopus arrhizus]KAG0768792.1 hypothetical protein G6F24_001628 [Rhizopus arrhizus]KAG0784558.1 hypothetical protein G6F22_008272 [Rhizopus arrhizus]KAG0795582.1 hypothetical protein G6F21_001992 [Rhizopus arrhizus]KAG0817157.1 hypothetical protein G6F20_002613 [Rhizopus arrhizus]
MGLQRQSKKIYLVIQQRQIVLPNQQYHQIYRKEKVERTIRQYAAHHLKSIQQVQDYLLSSSEEEEEEIKEVRSDFGVDDLDPDIAAYLNESSKAAAEPEKISIKLQYVNDSIQKYENKLLKPMIVIVMNDEQFDKILSTFCKHKKLKKEEVILSYREDKVFLRGTPAGIGMVGPETRTMYVYPVQVWEEKLKKEETKLNKRLKLNQSDDAMEEEEDEKMIIKLRGDDGKEISARVKRSTLLSAAAEMYKKITKIEGKIQLYFEGEPLNLGLAIADTELETFRSFKSRTGIRVQYKDTTLENGMVLSEEQSSQMPLVSFELASPDKDYTLIMFDIDTGLTHWVVTDIHGIENGGTSARTQIPYKQTVPNHRYLFTIFEQPQKDQSVIVDRYFDIKQFLEQNHLQLTSALYMKQEKKRSREKRVDEISEVGHFVSGLASNVMGFLKAFGIEPGRKSESFNFIDQGKAAFESSFNSMKSAHDNKQIHDINPVSNLFYTKKLISTASVPTNSHQSAKEDNPAKAVESVISKVFRDIQNNASAQAQSTAVASAQVPTPSTRKNPNESIESDKNTNPWFFGGLQNVMDNVSDFRKKIADKLKENLAMEEKLAMEGKLAMEEDEANQVP